MRESLPLEKPHASGFADKISHNLLFYLSIRDKPHNGGERIGPLLADLYYGILDIS